MKKISVSTLVAIGIGAALFFVLGRFASFPIFANTNLNMQYAVLCFLAVLYGPVAGALVGLIGHALIDFTSYGPWWSWILSSAIVGCLAGFIPGLFKKFDPESGNFGVQEIIWFNIANIAANGVAWFLIAPTLDIIIYQEPADKVYLQGIIAGTANIVTTLVIGTLLLFAYSKTRTKKGSLDKA
jgi:energy-coupling factor transport system substrate-specific component